MGATAVIDYGTSNIDSICRALEQLEGEPRVVAAPGQLIGCERAILPGVGSFKEAIGRLDGLKLIDPVQKIASEGTPILGVCLGMQLLATTGMEGGVTEGLALLPGTVQPLRLTGSHERIPHTGWNEVVLHQKCDLLDGIPSGSDFYFVHSYHFVPKSPEAAVASTPYCGGFVSVAAKENVFGTQFHPEKSQILGLHLLKNFLKLPC